MIGSNERQARALARLLARVLGPRARLTPSRHAPSGYDVVHVLTADGDGLATLAPVPAGAGYPQDIRRALVQIPDLDPEHIPVLVARRMSPGAGALADEAGISWADEAGALRLAAGLLVVAVDAAPTSPTPPRPSEPGTVRWSDGSGAVAELLLGRAVRSDEPQIDAVTAIADHLGLSAPLVSRTLSTFDRIGWTERSGPSRGPHVVRRLVDPGAMLSSWAAWSSRRPRPTTVAHALFTDPEDWVRGLVEVWPEGRWSVTGEAAAQVRAPYLSRVQVVDVYLDPDLYDTDLDDLLGAASLERVATGGRVHVLRADPYLARLVADSPTVADVPLVPDVRIYADLLAGGVRGDEAATELRDRRIRY